MEQIDVTKYSVFGFRWGDNVMNEITTDREFDEPIIGTCLVHFGDFTDVSYSDSISGPFQHHGFISKDMLGFLNHAVGLKRPDDNLHLFPLLPCHAKKIYFIRFRRYSSNEPPDLSYPSISFNSNLTEKKCYNLYIRALCIKAVDDSLQSKTIFGNAIRYIDMSDVPDYLVCNIKNCRILYVEVTTAQFGLAPGPAQSGKNLITPKQFIYANNAPERYFIIDFNVKPADTPTIADFQHSIKSGPRIRLRRALTARIYFAILSNDGHYQMETGCIE